MASLAPQASTLKQAGKVVCIGRNFAYALISSLGIPPAMSSH